MLCSGKLKKHGKLTALHVCLKPLEIQASLLHENYGDLLCPPPTKKDAKPAKYVPKQVLTSLSFVLRYTEVPEKGPHDPPVMALGNADLSEREGRDQGKGFIL